MIPTSSYLTWGDLFNKESLNQSMKLTDNVFHLSNHSLVNRGSSRDVQKVSVDVCRVYKSSYPLVNISCTDNNEIVVNNIKFLIEKESTESRNRNFEDMLNTATLADQLSQKYEKGQVSTKPMVNQDPGRIRCYEFFDAMYGKTESEVRKNLTAIQWVDGTKLLITRKNNVNKHLQTVSDELKKLPQHFRKYLNRPGGTFNYRTIAQTNRKSAHSYGIAIDINVQYSHYWLNTPQKGGKVVYQNSIPFEIVEVFEKHGFIWGGKWYHYDTMHFEYRPELCKTECSCGLE